MFRKKLERIEKRWREGKLTVPKLKKIVEKRLKVIRVYIDPQSRPGFKVKISFFDNPENQLDKYPAEAVTRMFSEKLGIEISHCRQHHKSLKDPLRLTPRWQAKVEAEGLRELMEKLKNFLDSIPEMEKEYREMHDLFREEISKPGRHRSITKIGGYLIHQKHRQETLNSFV